MNGRNLTAAEVRNALKRVVIPATVTANKLVESLLKTYVSVERIDGTTVVLGFKHPNWMEKINNPESLRATADALSAVLGMSVAVVCTEVREPPPQDGTVNVARD